MNRTAIVKAAVACAVLFVLGCRDTPTITTSSPEAKRRYNEGVALLEKFYLPEAKQSLEEAVRLDTGFAMAYARLALLYQRAGSEDTARFYVGRAMRHAQHAGAYEQLFIRMLDHVLHFRYAVALRTADTLTERYPNNAEGFVFRADLLEINKQADAALDMYKQAVKVDPSYAPAAMSLGYAYSTRGNEAEAIKSMQRYIELVPNAADPRASFADILLRTGRYAEALEQYRTSLSLKPNYWYSQRRIGDVYAILGRLNDAARQYDSAAISSLQHSQAQADRVATEGWLQLGRGQWADALRQYDRALSLDSTNFRAAVGLVHALVKLNRRDEAERTLERIQSELLKRNLTSSPVMMQWYLLRSHALHEWGRLDDALAACDSALQFGSELTRAEVYHQRAKIQLAKKQYDHALDALEEALRFNPNNPEVLLTLARVYAASGDTVMAREIANRLLALWKDADSDFLPLKEVRSILSQQRHASFRSPG